MRGRKQKEGDKKKVRNMYLTEDLFQYLSARRVIEYEPLHSVLRKIITEYEDLKARSQADEKGYG